MVDKYTTRDKLFYGSTGFDIISNDFQSFLKTLLVYKIFSLLLILRQSYKVLNRLTQSINVIYTSGEPHHMMVR